MRRTCLTVLIAIWALGIGLPAMAAEPDDVPLKLTKTETTITVSLGDRPLMEYEYGNVPKKPYVKRLFTPAGVNVLLDAPKDHLHHHALMFAVAAAGVDFWSEADHCGRQVQRSLKLIEPRARGPFSEAGLAQTLDWVDPQGKTLLREDRRVKLLHFPEAPFSVLVWESDLLPPEGVASVELSGSHYFGLGLRMVEAMDTVGTHFNSTGKLGPIVRGDERVSPANWSAYTAPVDGKPITVAMLDHPRNARHPAHFFTMRQHFAYISATMNLKKEPLTILAEKPLRLRYATVVWDGKADATDLEQIYGHWSGSRPSER